MLIYWYQCWTKLLAKSRSVCKTNLKHFVGEVKAKQAHFIFSNRKLIYRVTDAMIAFNLIEIYILEIVWKEYSGNFIRSNADVKHVMGNFHGAVLVILHTSILLGEKGTEKNMETLHFSIKVI